MNDGNGEYKLESEGADAWRPFKSGTTLELLWEGNQDRTSWSGGLIDVDLSPYQGLIVYGFALGGAIGVESRDCEYIDIDNPLNDFVSFQYGGWNIAYRKFTISDNKITFASTGVYDGEASKANAGIALPYAIYGVPR